MKEYYSNYNKHKNLKLVLITILMIILAVGSFTGGVLLRKMQYNSLVNHDLDKYFIGRNKEIEYGTELSIIELKKQLLDPDPMLENVSIDINDEKQSIDKTYKFLKLNDNTIKCTIKDSINGKIVSTSKTYIYNVVDTVKPILTGISDKEIKVGEEIDLKSGITASDPVDGELDVQIEGDFNKDKAGEYIITAKAVDNNKNETSENFKVIVKNKEENNTKAEQKQETKKTAQTENKSGNQNNNSGTSPQSGSQTTSGQNSGTQTPATPATEEPKTEQDTFNYKVLSSNATNTFNLVNKERANAGLNNLTLDSRLSKVAEARAMDLAKTKTFSHTTPNLGTPADTMSKYGYSYTMLAENLAGNRTDSAAVAAWMNSSGHKQNILNGNYKKTGIGVVTSPVYGKIYCQIFTN